MKHSADCIYSPGQEAKPPKPGARAACCKAGASYMVRRQARRERHELMTSMGLVRVRGALGGVYYE